MATTSFPLFSGRAASCAAALMAAPLRAPRPRPDPPQRPLHLDTRSSARSKEQAARGQQVWTAPARADHEPVLDRHLLRHRDRLGAGDLDDLIDELLLPLVDVRDETRADTLDRVRGGLPAREHGALRRLDGHDLRDEESR